MTPELLITVADVALDGSFLSGPVAPLDLPVGPLAWSAQARCRDPGTHVRGAPRNLAIGPGTECRYLVRTMLIV